ncbi:box C/D snoRNA protein 1 [Palaemon carinicauda]|uniref:box C/D snoRNA protein 1 n=1 Tax=Palaemon carinicauda TaxID=392227 RepID=UPI0035B63D72
METDIKEIQAGISRLGICSVCVSSSAKYTCPACSAKTCSLACVKTHKKNANCNGTRNKTAMVHKEEMNNLTLLSDYRFLEEIDHKLDDNHRHPLRRHIMLKHGERPPLPHFLQRLKSEAWNRGTLLKFMPNHFVAHQENSTRYYFKEGIIRWHVKWIFHQADVTFVDKDVDENTTIVKLLSKYLEPNDSLGAEDSEKLAYYHSASYGRVAVLLRTNEKGSGPAFEEAFMKKSLRLNLANKTVIEYPVFYVILRDHIHSYLEYEADDHDDLFCEKEEKEEEGESLGYF